MAPMPALAPRLHRLILLLLLGVAVAPAQAQVVALYEGETTVDSQSAEQRAAALPRALAQVLVKVSGDPQIVADAQAQGALAGASSLMQRYRYRQDTVMQNGVPAMKTVLIAQFDQAAVEALIGQTGQSEAIHSPEAWTSMVVRLTKPPA